MLSYSNANGHVHLLREGVACISDGALEIRVHVEPSEQNQNGPILIDNVSSSREEMVKNSIVMFTLILKPSCFSTLRFFYFKHMFHIPLADNKSIFQISLKYWSMESFLSIQLISLDCRHLAKGNNLIPQSSSSCS